MAGLINRKLRGKMFLQSLKKTALFIVLILLAVSVFSDESRNNLKQNAIEYSPGYFHEEDEFVILGYVEITGKDVILANNVHIWGEAERAAWRLLLFSDNGALLGMYTGIVFDPAEIKLEKQRAVFPFDAKYGNLIDFSSGIPEEIWLDGEYHSYMKANELD